METRGVANPGSRGRVVRRDEKDGDKAGPNRAREVLLGRESSALEVGADDELDPGLGESDEEQTDSAEDERGVCASVWQRSRTH